jgi:hypothetical protein
MQVVRSLSISKNIWCARSPLFGTFELTHCVRTFRLAPISCPLRDDPIGRAASGYWISCAPGGHAEGFGELDDAVEGAMGVAQMEYSSLLLFSEVLRIAKNPRRNMIE